MPYFENNTNTLLCPSVTQTAPTGTGSLLTLGGGNCSMSPCLSEFSPTMTNAQNIANVTSTAYYTGGATNPTSFYANDTWNLQWTAYWPTSSMFTANGGNAALGVYLILDMGTPTIVTQVRIWPYNWGNNWADAIGSIQTGDNVSTWVGTASAAGPSAAATAVPSRLRRP